MGIKFPSFRTILKVAGQIAPVVLAATGHEALAPYVANGVSIASQHPTATNADKLDLATQTALNGLNAANAEAVAQGLPPIFDTTVAASLIRNASGAVWDASKVVIKHQAADAPQG